MYIALDTETELVRQGLKAPPLVCLTWTGGGAPDEVGLVDRARALGVASSLILDGLRDGVHLVGHNMAYDMSVLVHEYPSLMDGVLRLYSEHRIHCTMLREKLFRLHDGTLAGKGYSLAALSKKYLGVELEKEDTYRKRYGELRLTPLELWPPEAKDYALADAEMALKVFNCQFGMTDGEYYPQDVLADGPAQAKYDFAFQIMCARGMMVDETSVKRVKKKLTSQLGKLKRRLVKEGLMDEKGSRKLKAIRQRLIDGGGELAKTATGMVSTEASQLRKSEDKALHDVAEYVHVQKLLSTYVGLLEGGNYEHPITPSCDVLRKTGRVSMYKPNLQNLPQADEIRECFKARDGFYFCIVDYEAAELRTLAQACLKRFGFSKMAQALNGGADPHTSFAADMLGIPLDEAIRLKKVGSKEFLDARQRAKAANFGFPGGMGITRFCETEAKKGNIFTEEEARGLKDRWLAQWPEMQQHFDYVKENIIQGYQNPLGTDLDGPEITGRYRGGLSFCDAANNPFQGLAANGAKSAVFALAKAMYGAGASPLKGSHLVNFVHDEVIVEVPIATAHECAEEIVRIMCEEMNKFTPDVPASAEPCLVRRWYKGAEPVYENGRLVPWEPKNTP